MPAPPPRVFISYARDDGEPFAVNLLRDIEAASIPVWRDREGMRGGSSWWEQIDTVLDEVEYLVLVLTPGALASATVMKECDRARAKGVCIYPVIAHDPLDWDSMPPWLSRGHCYDLGHQKSKFLNDLDVRCERIRVPFHEDTLPTSLLPRAQIYDGLLTALTAKRTDGPITVALRGAGGFGKSTLARALCQDKRIRDVFHQGILWVSLGEEPITNLAARIEDQIYRLTNERPGYQDASLSSQRLRDLLRDRKLLIVLDDLWRESDARPFLVGGSECAHLITTRQADTLPSGAIEIAVEELEETESLQLLGDSLPVNDEAGLPGLAERLGNWPLLVSLVNRLLVEQVRRKRPVLEAIRYANDKLDYHGLTAFDRNSSNDRDAAVERTVAASLDFLRESQGDDHVARFEELAVFPAGADIPLAAVTRMWRHIDEFLTVELCERLHDYSLIQRLDLDRRVIRLHDVMTAYLRRRTAAQHVELQGQLVDAYRESCGGKWERLPDDKYVHTHLAAHLYAADRRTELYTLVEPLWRKAQRALDSSENSFWADVELAIRAAVEESDWAQVLRLCILQATVYQGASTTPLAVLAALVWMNKANLAHDKAALIGDAALQSRAHISIAAALAARDDAAASETFARASRIAQGIASARSRCQAFDALARALTSAGRYDEALVAASACLAAAKASEFGGAWDRIRAAELLLLVDDRPRATALIGEIASETDKKGQSYGWPDERLALAVLLRETGDVDRADAVATPALDIVRGGPEVRRSDGVTEVKFTVTLDLIESLARLGDVDRAIRHASQFDPRAASDFTLARVFRSLGDHAKAAELDRSGVAAATSGLSSWTRWSDDPPAGRTRPTNTEFVITTLLDLGEQVAAERFATSFRDPASRANALALLGLSDARAGRTAAAQRRIDDALEGAVPVGVKESAALLTVRIALLKVLPTNQVAPRVQDWCAGLNGIDSPLQDRLTFAIALAQHDPDRAIEIFESHAPGDTANEHARAMAELASALSDVRPAEAVVFARRAVDVLPETFEEHRAEVVLQTLASAASVVATRGGGDLANQWVDRVLHFFATRPGNARSLAELGVWESVLSTLVRVGRESEVMPQSESIYLWGPSPVLAKVRVMRTLARGPLSTRPELAHEAKLIAVRTALMLAELVPPVEGIDWPTATGSLISELLIDAKAEAQRIRKQFLPSGVINPALEAIFARAQASALLADIEPSSAADLAAAVLHIVAQWVWTGIPLPRSQRKDFHGQLQLLATILGSILDCYKLVTNDERTQSLPDDCYRWVVANARVYNAAPALASGVYMTGARAFRLRDFREHSQGLFKRALLVARPQGPDPVLQLIADGADILASVDEGASLRKGMDLVETMLQ